MGRTRRRRRSRAQSCRRSRLVCQSFYLLLYTLACQINITHPAYMKHVLYTRALYATSAWAASASGWVLRAVVAHFLKVSWRHESARRGECVRVRVCASECVCEWVCVSSCVTAAHLHELSQAFRRSSACAGLSCGGLHDKATIYAQCVGHNCL